MSTNSSVTFSARDNGVGSFMDKMKQKSSEMTSQFIRDAEKQAKSANELLKIVEARIKMMEKSSRIESSAAQQSVSHWAEERKNRASFQFENLRRGYKQEYQSGIIDKDTYRHRMSRLNALGVHYSPEGIDNQAKERIQHIREQSRSTSNLVKLMMQNIDTIRQTGKEQVSATKAGDSKIVDSLESDDLDKKQNEVLQRLVNEEIGDDKGSGRKQYLNKLQSFGAALAFDRVGGMIANMPNARSELDFAKPMMSLAGMATGGGMGLALDLVSGLKIFGTGLGQANFTSLGTQLGSKAGEFFGAAIERTFRGRDEMYSGLFKTTAISGRSAGATDLSSYGMDYKEAAALQSAMTLAKGGFVGSGELGHIQALESGYGVNSGSVQSMMELVRSNAWSDRYVPSIIAGIKQGMFGQGDRSFLNEFITKNYAQLQKTLIQTNETVQSGTVLSILQGFNKVGGQFDMKDPRSSGLISQIQGSLSNPGSDAGKALAFHIMRQSNPEMSLLDTQIEIQKGMGSKKYLQSMMGYILGQGGDESYQVNNVASFFGLQGNLSAAKRLVSGYQSGSLEEFSQYNLSSGLGEAAALGTSQTSQYSRSAAEIENAFISSAVTGLAVMKNKMTDLFGNMMDELSVMVRKMIKDAFGDSAPIPEQEFNNRTKKLDKSLDSMGLGGGKIGDMGDPGANLLHY